MCIRDSREPFPNQAARIIDIGGQKHVEGRMVADLGVEIAGGSVDDAEVRGGMRAAEIAEDVVERKLQVGGGGDGDLLARGGAGRAADQNGRQHGW